MGWDGCYYNGSVKDWIRNGEFEMRNERRSNDGTGYKVLAKSVKGNTVYSAVKHPTGHVFGMVTLLRKDRDGYLMVKDMDETMGPCEDECPMKIINMLSATEYEYALDWRERCRNHKNIVKERNAKRKELDALPLKSVITVKGEEYHVCKNEYSNAKSEGLTILISPKTGKYVKKSQVVLSGWEVVRNMGTLKTVVCLDDMKEYYFAADNNYDAMTKMLYTLNLSKRDDSASIVKLNKSWAIVHDGKTYGALLD